jgi:glutamine amidotransferase
MIGILDYGMGNLRSVANAFINQGGNPTLVRSKAEMDKLTHLVIPGVGAFKQAKDNLEKFNLVEPIIDFVKTGKPVLGICLGMQLLASVGYEVEKTFGLNVIPGEVIKFENIPYRIPHVGWNAISLRNEHYLFEGIKKGVDFYFVHSYYFKPCDYTSILATCFYGHDFAAVIHKKNVIGIQFHPEKSQKNGLKIISNFIHTV